MKLPKTRSIEIYEKDYNFISNIGEQTGKSSMVILQRILEFYRAHRK